MANVLFKTNVITSDGAKLLERASADDKVYIYKTAYIDHTYDRNEAANFHYNDIKDKYAEQLQGDPNVTGVLASVSGSGKQGAIYIQTAQSNANPFPVKGLIVLACLYSERTNPQPVVFAVMCDDNIVYECNSTPLEMSVVLPVSSENIYTFGENELPDIDTSGFATKTELESYATKSELSDYATDNDIADLQTFTVDSSGDVESGGLEFTLEKEGCYDVEISGNNVPVSVDVDGSDLVILTGNGDKYTISGVTVTKTSEFEQIPIIGYFTEDGVEGDDLTIGSGNSVAGVIRDEAGEIIYPGSLTPVYTVQEIENKAGVTQETGASFILDNQGERIAWSYNSTPISVYKIYMLKS